MIKTIELSDSHHLLLDRMADDRAQLDAREARALASMLRERGGKLDEGWQFDRVHRVFYINVPDPSDATANPTDAGTNLAG